MQEPVPSKIIEDARRDACEVFLTRYGQLLLIVRLGSLRSEVAAGLLASWTGAGVAPTPNDSLGYDTVTTTVISARAARALRPKSPVPDGASLRQVLGSSPCFLAPLQKRADFAKPFQGRISVGRARNNDIVLRDESVSKFHAWFECDEENAFYVGDARSKNHTRVNGTTIAGPELTPLEPGDELKFGSVEALLVPASEVWKALALRP